MLKKNYFEMRVEPFEYSLGYGYFLLKIYDLFETFFFVLRKKQNQVSFLHVYHHMMILIFVYLGMRSLPGKREFIQGICSKIYRFLGGHNIYYGFVNTIVHAFMYTYYFLAAYDSNIKWLSKWKKFITQIQLVSSVNHFFLQER